MNSKFSPDNFEFLVSSETIRSCDFQSFIEKLHGILEAWSITNLLERKANSAAVKDRKEQRRILGEIKTAIQSMSASNRRALLLYEGVTSGKLNMLSAACDKAANPFGNRPRGMRPDHAGENLCAELASLYSEYSTEPATGYECGNFVRFLCQGFEAVNQKSSPAAIRKKIARMNQKFRDNE